MMIEKDLTLGNQRIQRKLYAYLIKVKLPNLAFLALHGPAITYLLKILLPTASLLSTFPIYLFTCLYQQAAPLPVPHILLYALVHSNKPFFPSARIAP